MEANLTRTISKYPAGAGYFFVRSSEPVQLFLLSSRAVVRSTAAKKNFFLCFFLLTLIAMIAIYISIETRKG
jgi:hypothetical protein